jgi:hypothetical protein
MTLWSFHWDSANSNNYVRFVLTNEPVHRSLMSVCTWMAYPADANGKMLGGLVIRLVDFRLCQTTS